MPRRRPIARKGAVVFDVGSKRLADGSLRGDGDFEAVLAGASFISRVPGGAAPMTVTMPIDDTPTSADRAAGAAGHPPGPPVANIPVFGRSAHAG